MWSYIVGGSGLALGALATLWFYLSATKAKGALALEKTKTVDLTEKLKTANAQIETDNQAQAQLIKQHQDELVRKEAQLAIHQRNEEALRAALAQSSVKNPQPLIDVANGLYGAGPHV